MNDEVAEPCRLLELFRGDSHLNSAVVEITRPQILQRIELRAGTKRREQKLGRSHSGVVAAVFEGLVAND